MRLAIPLLALALLGCTPPTRSAAGGIVSTNPCADAILIDLVTPDRIAAISHYSKDPAASSIAPAVARRFAATAGTAEEVIALNPELVLTSSFTPLATRAAYQRAGLKTLVLDSPTTVAASQRQITEIAAALGAVAEGRALNERIDAALAAALPIGASPSLGQNGGKQEGKGAGKHSPSALLYISGDLATGAGTLLDELLTRAGFTDAAAHYGLTATGTLTIETIAADPPRVILTPDAQSRTATLRRRVLQRTGARTVDARFPRNLVNCGGPTIIPAITRLAEIRRAL